MPDNILLALRSTQNFRPPELCRKGSPVASATADCTSTSTSTWYLYVHGVLTMVLVPGTAWSRRELGLVACGYKSQKYISDFVDVIENPSLVDSALRTPHSKTVITSRFCVLRSAFCVLLCVLQLLQRQLSNSSINNRISSA